MTLPREAELTVAPVPAAEGPETLRLLLQTAPDPEGQTAAVLAAVERGEMDYQGLFAARRGGRLAGAVWGRVQPGRLAFVWPPSLAEAEPEASARILLAALDQFLRDAPVCLAQALTDDDGGDTQRLLAAGYRDAATLLYLACFRARFPRELPETELDFEPFNPRNPQRLAQLIEATYDATLDLPVLNDVRNVEDVLDSYRGTGAFDPNRWLLVRCGGEDVGCLLLTEHPAERQWELIYMGLTRSARGRGWGLQMTRYGQWLARCGGASRLVLAVDAANEPALAAYGAAGFEVWLRRRVLLKTYLQR